MSGAPDDPQSFLPFERSALEQSLVRRFAEQVRRHGERLAVTFGPASATYGELNRAANRVAHALLGGLGEGAEPVAMLLGPGLGQVAGHLGVLKSGKTCVPMDPAQPQARLERILAETGARRLLTDRAHRDRAAALAGAAGAAGEVLEVEARGGASDDRDPGVTIAPDALAYVFYTAGSTGEPKGVMQTHRNLLQVARLYNNEFRLRPADRILCPMPLVYAGGTWGLLGALVNGAAFCRGAADGAHGLSVQLARDEITVTQLMTSLLRQLLRELDGSSRFPSLRLVYTGGEVLHPRDVDRFRAVLPRSCELLYDLGSSEAGLVSHLRVDAQADAAMYTHHRDGTAMVPVGHALDGVEVLVLADDGTPVPAGAAGQIAVRSEYLSPGYWGDADRTRAAYQPDPAGGRARIYLTGDRGAVLPDGRLLHLGRMDLQAKIRGHRVGMGEIEAALRADPAIADAAVVAREDARGDARLVAYVAVASTAPVTVSALRRRLAASLPESMIPSVFVVLEALPLSPAGKVDRAALPDPGTARPDLDVPYVAPRTQLEETLADLWADSLGLERVGMDDHFLELGGHSLAAARLVFRLQERLGLDVPAESLFETPTIGGMATALLQRLAGTRPEADVRAFLDALPAR